MELNYHNGVDIFKERCKQRDQFLHFLCETLSALIFRRKEVYEGFVLRHQLRSNLKNSMLLLVVTRENKNGIA